MTDIKPGDRALSGGYVCTVEAVSGPDRVVCLRYPDGSLGLERESVLTLITPKIAQPGMGEVVWDFYEPAGKRIPWRHSSEKGWTAYYDGLWLLRDWADFSDDVTLAVDPKAGA